MTHAPGHTQTSVLVATHTSYAGLYHRLAVTLEHGGTVAISAATVEEGRRLLENAVLHLTGRDYRVEVGE